MNFSPLILAFLAALALVALFLFAAGVLRLTRRHDELAMYLSYGALTLGTPFLFLGWYWLPFGMIALPGALFSVGVGWWKQREALSC